MHNHEHKKNITLQFLVSHPPCAQKKKICLTKVFLQTERNAKQQCKFFLQTERNAKQRCMNVKMMKMIKKSWKQKLNAFMFRS